MSAREIPGPHTLFMANNLHIILQQTLIGFASEHFPCLGVLVRTEPGGLWPITSEIYILDRLQELFVMAV